MPVVYGLEHCIYIAVSLVTAFVVCFCAHRFVKTEKAQRIMLKIFAGVLLSIIFINRVVLVFEHGGADWKKMWPDTFCSTSSFVLPLALLLGKKDNDVLHFIWLIALAGGVITTFYPDFIGQNESFLYLPTILGMVHHTVAAILVVVTFMFGYIRIRYTRWRCTLYGFACYLAYGGFLLTALKIGNPFYMEGPALPNTPLTVWGIAPIYIVVYATILIVAELVRKRKLKNKQ